MSAHRLQTILLAAFAFAISLSIAASEITFFAALLVRIVRHVRGERMALRPRALLTATAAIVLVWSLCGLFAPEPGASIAWVLRLCQVLAVFLIAEHAADPGAARALVLAYFGGVVAGTAYGLGWFAWNVARFGYDRLTSGFSTAMTTGNVFATAWVAAVAVLGGPLPFRGRGARVLPAIAAIGAELALVASLTRSSWLGGVVGLLVVAVRTPRRWIPAVAIATGLFLTFGIPQWRDRAASSVVRTDYTSQGRISLWKTGWELFRERPISGWGLADHGQRIAAHRRADATFVAGHFHSNPVQVAVSTGILGSLAYAAFHLTLLALLLRRRGALAIGALGVWTAFQVAGFFDWSFGDAEVTYQFFYWMGLGLAAGAPGDPDRAARLAHSERTA